MFLAVNYEERKNKHTLVFSLNFKSVCSGQELHVRGQVVVVVVAVV